MKHPSVLSFFSGSGFLDLGFEHSNFNVVYVNEVFKPFLEAYKYSREKLKNKPPKYGYFEGTIEDCLSTPELDKICSIIEREKKEGRFVGFIGGPPCPDFSVAGTNKGKHGENGRLSKTYVELILLFQPDFFIFENVKGLWRTKKHREFYESLKMQLIAQGYVLTDKLVNALEYGAPQNRDRIILFGIKNTLLNSVSIDNFQWEKHMIYPNGEAFKFIWPEIGKIFSATKIDKKLTVSYWFRKNDVLNHPNSKHVFVPRAGLQRFKQILEGDDKRKSFKRLHRYKYSPTAAYGNNEVHIHPTEPRRITVAEALAIQSLPKDFVLPSDMSLTNMFKTIGNGVPYLTSKGIALTIYDFLKKIN